MIVEELLQAIAIFESFCSAFVSGRKGSGDIGVFEAFSRARALQETMDEPCIEAVARADGVH